MKLETRFKSVVEEVICLLYVLLFVYAAVSKLLDFENFQVQLGQSPLLSAFAFWVSWLVPVVELITAGMLLIPRYRIPALYAALSLMAMFSAYIFIVLHYSSFVPCSCGGILEKMSWNTHLIFNICFALLSVLAILFHQRADINNKKKVFQFRWISTALLCSISAVVILFISSEKIMHSENPFTRRYPPHPAAFSNAVDLKFNSYYFAGFSNNRIYLANYTTPDQILSLSEKLEDPMINKIIFDPKNIPFRIVTTQVKGKYFYLLDGSVPKIFRGDIKSWKINKELKGIPHFTKALPMDSSKIAFRSNKGKSFTNILGVFTSGSPAEIKYNKTLLGSRGDGIFDTDGILLYDDKLQRIVYLYYYSNKFMVADKNGELEYRGHTIDTIQHSKIKVSALKNGSEYAISSPSYVVNPHAAVYLNLLFVHSAVKGKFENDKLWEQSFIIDVYDLSKHSYLMSFPIYHTRSKKLDSFVVSAENLYAKIGNDLVVYQLGDYLKKEMKLH